MRINAHAHIFNLQTVLTEEAITIMVARLERLGLPDFVLEAVREILTDQLLRPEYLVEDELLRRFVRAIGRSGRFQDFLRATASLPVEIQLLGTAPDELATDTLRTALDRLSTRLDARDESKAGIFDVFETLRLAMQPDIVSVADRHLEHMGPDDALVALMMDIVAEQEEPRDRLKFLAQIRGTADAVIRRPGRILPFIAVNPARPDHFALMSRALEQLGFVGVKLYPSLGYEVTTAAIGKVLDYCEENDVPIVMHCTAGGFYRSPATTGYCHPRHWEELLQGRPGLRVSFAHCGGWAGFGNLDDDQAEWFDRIRDYMDHYPGVYGDLSYHVEMMTGGVPEARYFQALRELLDHPVYGGRVLFGTDSWLVRLNLPDDAYWSYFRAHLQPAELDRIAGANPRAFLGLPDEAGNGMRPNIRRHIEFLEEHRDAVGAEPAAWVRQASQARFTPVRSNPAWSPNNRAHVVTYGYFRRADLIPPAFRHLHFQGSGPIRLRQLLYWQKEHESEAIFRQRVAQHALNLNALCRRDGAAFEGDYDDTAAVARLEELLGDGDRTLAEAGATVDAIYRFSTELV